MWHPWLNHKHYFTKHRQSFWWRYRHLWLVKVPTIEFCSQLKKVLFFSSPQSVPQLVQILFHYTIYFSLLEFSIVLLILVAFPIISFARIIFAVSDESSSISTVQPDILHFFQHSAHHSFLIYSYCLVLDFQLAFVTLRYWS